MSENSLDERFQYALRQVQTALEEVETQKTGTILKLLCDGYERLDPSYVYL